jgi:hypothetical protein
MPQYVMPSAEPPQNAEKKGGGNYAVFYFIGKRFLFFVYDVITWENQEKGSAYYY